jgi:hypothetical protein
MVLVLQHGEQRNMEIHSEWQYELVFSASIRTYFVGPRHPGNHFPPLLVCDLFKMFTLAGSKVNTEPVQAGRPQQARKNPDY